MAADKESSVPRYFFHIVKGSEVLACDMTGRECSDDQAARRHAQSSDGASAFWSEVANLLRIYHLQVRNEAGKVIFKFPLAGVRAAECR
jgi:hypothetical protein